MYKLSPTLPLSGFERKCPSFEVTENYIGECVSLAMAIGQEEAFYAAFRKAFGIDPPPPSQAVQIKDGWALWSGASQYMLLLDGENIRADLGVAAKFEGCAYATLQTDGWASTNITGERVHDVLERFIPLDLRRAPINFSARTSAHHIAVIVMKFGEDKYNLMTPRSSARSFLEGLVHTCENILG